MDYRVSDFVKRIMNKPLLVPDIDNEEKKYYASKFKEGYTTHNTGTHRASRNSLMKTIDPNADTMSYQSRILRDNSMQSLPPGQGVS